MDLGTGPPTSEALRTAIRTVLVRPKYREHARRLRDDIVGTSPFDTVAATLARAASDFSRGAGLDAQVAASRTIVDQGGFGNPGNAYRLAQQFLAKAPDAGTIAHQRKVENLRLDAIWRPAWSGVEAGNVATCVWCLKCPADAAC